MESIKKNIAYQTLYQILLIIIPLVTSPYISRVLGANNLGIYSYTQSIAQYFVLFSLLGINNYGNRAIAKSKSNKDQLDKTYSSILALHIIISCIFIVLYVIYVTIFINNHKIYFYIQLIYVVSALFDINWLFFGLEKFKITVTRNAIIKFITVSCIFIFIKNEADLIKYFLILTIGSFISQTVVWIFVKEYVSFIKPTFKEIFFHLKPLFILFIPVIAVSIYRVMDKIMLGSMVNTMQVGFYELSEKAIAVPLSVITAFGTVMLPRITSLNKIGREEQSIKYIRLSIKYVMLLSLPLSFGISAVSKKFSIIFWGENFFECSRIIMILSLTIPFIALANIIRTQYLLPKNNDKDYIISIILGAIINLVCNIIFIPKYAALGAAMGTLMAEITVCVVQIIFVWNKIPIYEYIKFIKTPIFFSILMYIIVRFISINTNITVVNLLCEIVIGALIYLTLTFFYLIYTKDKILYNLLLKIKEYIQ